jgi:hypothetical protein
VLVQLVGGEGTYGAETDLHLPGSGDASIAVEIAAPPGHYEPRVRVRYPQD